jgi:hypothetical protein
MQVSFQYTLGDVLEVSAAQRRLWFRKEAAKFFVALVGLAVAIPCVMTLVFSFSLQAGVVSASAAIASMVIVIFQSQAVQAKQMWNSAAWLREPFTVELTPSGLQMDSSMIRTQRAWSAFAFYLETPNLFILNQGAHLFAWLPKRAFTEAQLAEARRLFADQIRPPKAVEGES